MGTERHSALRYFLVRFPAQDDLQALQGELEARPELNLQGLIALYQRAIPAIEQALWAAGADDAALEQYQHVFQELEALIAQGGRDTRHAFVLVIPVADRPQQLQSCLESLLQLCRRFQYGGLQAGRYAKVSVLVADDSKNAENRRQNRELAHHYQGQGLACEYFSQEAQWHYLERLGEGARGRLQRVLGEGKPSAFYHKGASIMRNIAYLRLNEAYRNDEHTLFYFIDSDQEFRITLPAAQGEREPYALNYFYHLDRIFSAHPVQVLTGKVVGDPPVSPAVMAGNFLDDLQAFLQEIRACEPEDSCRFHRRRQQADDAAYHDMAELFGFKSAVQHFDYSCPLEGGHDHRDCLRDFTQRLTRFFDGEHPTRRSYFEYAPLERSLVPARTIYTGNYVFTPRALDYFIPFARLKLRMAGPVLGRLIKAELGEGFVSANLPMLHRRTLEALGQAEFRSGIERAASRVDLSDEFERQYFGDVMLFSMERLSAAGYPAQTPSREVLEELVGEVEAQLYAKYLAKQRQIGSKLAALRRLFEQPEAWWNSRAELDYERAALGDFLDNIAGNFARDARAYTLIGAGAHKRARLQAIVEALLSYGADRAAWREVLSA